MLRLIRVLLKKTTIFNLINNSAVKKYFGVSRHFSVGNITYIMTIRDKMYFQKKNHRRTFMMI